MSCGFLWGRICFLSLERWIMRRTFCLWPTSGPLTGPHPHRGRGAGGPEAAAGDEIRGHCGHHRQPAGYRPVLHPGAGGPCRRPGPGSGDGPVYGYIQRRGLYGVHTDLHHLTPDQLRPIALSYLKPKRMPHVLGTEQEAVRLARQYGADETQARIAALLHDCTKKLDMDRQLALCRQYGIPLDDLEQHALKLLHAKTGAAIARDVFAVDDAVYRAIYWHTTGHANMTKLEKIIYLADYIEPSRDFPGVDDLRRAVHADLDRGLLKALDDSIRDMQQWGNPVHHNTLDARDYLLRGKQI